MSESLLEKLARIELELKQIKSNPTIKQVDYSMDITLIKKELSDIRKLIQNKKEFDFAAEFKKHSTLEHINNLYRTER